METIRKFDTLSGILLIVLAATDIFLWHSIFSDVPISTAHVFFLDVGQGDSEIIVFPGNIKVITDAGPDNKVLAGLSSVFPRGENYIDLAIISYPTPNNFAGFSYILDHYAIGAFLYNGRDAYPTSGPWLGLHTKIKQKNIPLITLGKPDSIHFGNESEIDIVSPDAQFNGSPDLTDTGLVEFIKSPGISVLLTADIGSNVQKLINLKADILKIPDHGLKYSLANALLGAVGPKIKVIEGGAHNDVTPSSSSNLYLTGQDGIVEIWSENNILRVQRMK